MMNKLLIYVLWMLFNMSTAKATWCYQCDKPIPTLPCPEMEEFCWAGNGAACFTMNLYIGSSMIQSEVGCAQNCNSHSERNPFMWHDITCCFTDYCNV